MDIGILGTGRVAALLGACGSEHYFLLFAALMRSLHTPNFNISLVQ